MVSKGRTVLLPTVVVKAVDAQAVVLVAAVLAVLAEAAASVALEAVFDRKEIVFVYLQQRLTNCEKVYL